MKASYIRETAVKAGGKHWKQMNREKLLGETNILGHQEDLAQVREEHTLLGGDGANGGQDQQEHGKNRAPVMQT